MVGKTPLKLAKGLDELGIPIIGTPSQAIDQAEDREHFQALLQKTTITATTKSNSSQHCKRLGPSRRNWLSVSSTPLHMF